MESKDIKLSNGAVVRVRPIPAHTFLAVGGDIQTPAPPTIVAQSAAGHSEAIPAPEDSPEYRAYLAEMGKVRQERVKAKSAFEFDYPVLAWKLPGGEWADEPPADWSDPALARLGVSLGNRRADYIRNVLLPRIDDLNKVAEFTHATSGAVTEQEVQAQLDGFRLEEGRLPAA